MRAVSALTAGCLCTTVLYSRPNSWKNVSTSPCLSKLGTASLPSTASSGFVKLQTQAETGSCLLPSGNTCNHKPFAERIETRSHKRQQMASEQGLG